MIQPSPGSLVQGLFYICCPILSRFGMFCSLWCLRITFWGGNGSSAQSPWGFNALSVLCRYVGHFALLPWQDLPAGVFPLFSPVGDNLTLLFISFSTFLKSPFLLLLALLKSGPCWSRGVRLSFKKTRKMQLREGRMEREKAKMLFLEVQVPKWVEFQWKCGVAGADPWKGWSWGVKNQILESWEKTGGHGEWLEPVWCQCLYLLNIY